VRESDDPQAAPAMRGQRLFPIVRCTNCQLAYVWPRYSDDELEILYADEQLFKCSTDPEGHKRSYLGEREAKQRYFVQVGNWLEQYKQGGELLEVGCGPGFFLDVLGSQWRGRGVDLSPYAVDYGRRELGLDLAQGAFVPGLYAPASFDAVAMLQVLDHLPNPRQALSESARLLRQGGVLLLTSLVNGRSYCARLFAGGYRLLAPNHLYYFSPRTLERLLRETGFALEKMRFPYWHTPYCNFREIKNLAVQSGRALAAHLRRREPRVLSPPFYGNHIDVVARKLPE
jgi:SAM-dependent methyltransferase